MYGVPTVAAGNVVFAIESWATTVIDSGHAKVIGGLFESVIVTVKLETPAAVGVPVTAPVLLLSDKPAGNDPLVTA